ncbi:MAG: NUDIX domain-containing protein, partial [Acidimicrobiia bacterium]
PAMIDFEDATVGDPAIDLVGLFNTLELSGVRSVLEHYGPFDSNFTARLRFYRWMSSVHGIRYALDTADEVLLRDSVAELEANIATRSRACAVVVRDGFVLLVQHRGLFWTLPGGGVEPGESDEDAAVRELREETGVRGRVVRELYRRTYGRGPEACFLVESDHDGEFVSEDPVVTDVAWHPLDELEDDPQISRVLAALEAQ